MSKELEIELLNYNNLPKEIDKEFGLSNNGYGKEYATYLIMKYGGEILNYESDAMEPEDTTFYRDLAWIKNWVEQAYDLGKKQALTELETLKTNNRNAFKEGYEQGRFDERMDNIDNRPPTAEEVCEALSKWLEDEVTYEINRLSEDNIHYVFRANRNPKTSYDDYIIFYSLDWSIYWDSCLPRPPLEILSLVSDYFKSIKAKFYEGVENNV